MHLHHPGLGRLWDLPRVTEQIRGKAVSGIWSPGIQGSVPSLACPTRGHIAWGQCTCLGPGEGGCPGKFIQKTQGHEERHREWVGRRYPNVREPGESPASVRQGLYLSSGFWACLAIWPSSLPVAKQGQERVPCELPWQRDTRAVRQRKEGLFHIWESPGAWVQAGRRELLGLQHPQTLQQRLGTEQKFLTGDSSWKREKLLQTFSSTEIPGPSSGLRPCFSNCNWHW